MCMLRRRLIIPEAAAQEGFARTWLRQNTLARASEGAALDCLDPTSASPLDAHAATYFPTFLGAHSVEAVTCGPPPVPALLSIGSWSRLDELEGLQGMIGWAGSLSSI